MNQSGNRVLMNDVEIVPEFGVGDLVLGEYPDGDKSFYYAKVTNLIYENADTESDLIGYVLKFFDGEELNLGFEKVKSVLNVGDKISAVFPSSRGRVSKFYVSTITKTSYDQVIPTVDVKHDDGTILKGLLLQYNIVKLLAST